MTTAGRGELKAVKRDPLLDIIDIIGAIAGADAFDQLVPLGKKPNKYRPHQGRREKARRIAHAAGG